MASLQAPYFLQFFLYTQIAIHGLRSHDCATISTQEVCGLGSIHTRRGLSCLPFLKVFQVIKSIYRASGFTPNAPRVAITGPPYHQIFPALLLDPQRSRSSRSSFLWEVQLCHRTELKQSLSSQFNHTSIASHTHLLLIKSNCNSNSYLVRVLTPAALSLSSYLMVSQHYTLQGVYRPLTHSYPSLPTRVRTLFAPFHMATQYLPKDATQATALMTRSAAKNQQSLGTPTRTSEKRGKAPS